MEENLKRKPGYLSRNLIMPIEITFGEIVEAEHHLQLKADLRTVGSSN